MKNKMHPFLKVLIILFFIYLALFIANKSGYYEGKVRNKMILTEEKKREFEEDIKEGKNVQIKSYLQSEKDYSNFLTKTANKVSNKLGDILEDDLNNVWSFFKSLFSS